MAFDLNKPGGEKKKFDLSKSNESASANSSVGNSNSRNGNKKPSSWIFIVIAIVLIGGGIWYFNSKKNTNLIQEQPTTAVATTDSTVLPVSTGIETTSANVDSSQVTSEKPIETEKQVESSQSSVKPVESSNTQVSTLPQGTIEEKAKQVIRGDFGNGIERKNALGSDYKEIQKKVNEMLRKGVI